jgi:hypothetical protein
MITVFRNIRETSTPFFRDILFVLDRIRVGVNKELINDIRRIEDKTERNELKKQLAAICFSGKFSRRSDDSISEHSGFICLDFDGYESVDQMNHDKQLMSNDEYVFSVFISPSGNGLKVIVPINKDIDNHTRYFDALKEYFKSPYFDKTSRNVSRVCYESYDPDIYINENASVWTELSDVTYEPIDSNKSSIVVTSESKIVDILLKWWNSKFGLVDGERNNNVFILASAFNEYGVSKSSAEYVIHQMQSSDFTLSEIQTTIDSGYKNTAAHGTKFYQDTDTVNRIKRDVRKGVNHQDIKESHRDIDDSIIDSVITSAANDAMEFWLVNKKGAVSVVHHVFKDFLESNGFYKYSPHGSNKYMYVKVTDNLIDVTDEKFIKSYVLDYIESLDNLDVYDFFINSTRLFKDDYLSMLDSVDVYFIKDTIDSCHIYFKNCALKVSASRLDIIDYIDLNGYVWRDQVIDRDYEQCDVNDCDFKVFISNVAGDDEKQIRSFESTIGFLMSSYKDPSFSPAVILNDEVITDNPEGGTGKGLFVKAISQMKKVSIIEGKKFSFDSQFAYQGVTTDSQVIQFDDVRRGFNFEMLFSVITEGITVEKKNKDAITIPFDESPKIIITTNYAIRGKGNSFERRKWEIEFKKFYSMNYTPYDEFKKRLFDSWNEYEWCAFDNYMISNLQLFLREGLIKGSSVNLRIRKLASETCHEFIEWVGLTSGSIMSDVIKYNKKLFKDDLYNDFIEDNPDFAPKAKMTVSRRVFYKWLIFFGEFYEDVVIQESRSNLGRWIMFSKDE